MTFFFSSRRRHTRCSRDWSSDVCSSDLATDRDTALAGERRRLEGLAFGLTTLTDSAPPGFPDVDAATTAVPIWDAERVLAKAATRRDLVRSPGTPGPEIGRAHV